MSDPIQETNEKPKDLIDKIDLVSLVNLGRRKKNRNKHYARFNRRMMAATIDSMVLLVLEPVFDAIAPIHQEALSSIAFDPNDQQPGLHLFQHILGNGEFMQSWFANLFIQAVALLLYSGVCWHFWSATPGKMLMRIKIVDVKTEANITDAQILMRLWGYVVSGVFFLMGFLWIGIDKQHRAWHDILAGTAVINLPWRKKQETVEKAETL